MRKISLKASIFMLILLLVGCAKDKVTEETTPVFVEKEYFAASQETIMDEVTAFLQYTDAYSAAISRKDDFPDTDPNQGMWLLEGGSNYFADYEMKPTDDVEITEYTLVIENIVENGAIKMKGHDLTSKFDGFQNQLTADIEGTPDLVDFRITSVDAQQSTLDVKVIKKKPRDINAAPGCSNWDDFRDILHDELDYEWSGSYDFDPTPPNGGIYNNTYVNVNYLIVNNEDYSNTVYYYNAPDALLHDQYFFKGPPGDDPIPTYALNYWANRSAVFSEHYFRYAMDDTFGDIQYNLLYYKVTCHKGILSEDDIDDDINQGFTHYFCPALITGIQAFS